MQAQRITIWGFLFTLSCSAALAEELEIRSTAADQKNLAVTIYNNNLALIKDQRKIVLNRGIQTVALRDVSAQIRPETALLHSLNQSNGLTVIEQNFDFDLLTPEKLLEKYVGKSVTLIKVNPANGNETQESAEVLSANNGVILKIGSRIETGIGGRIVYDDVPKNLRDKPTLTTKINNHSAGEHTLELSYLSGGLSWKADYVAELNASEDKIDLSGWVTLNNTSGTRYANAKLQLVAGEVNRVSEAQMRPLAVKKTLEMAADNALSVSEEPLLEYHLYTLPQQTTITENQTKQIALLSATKIPVRKQLLLQGADYYYGASYSDLGRKLSVSTFLEFDNKEAAQLGIPLPKGIVRVYKQDRQGNGQFVGEDKINHTPKNETVRLKLGEAFDVTADKKQVDFKLISRSAKGSLSEGAYEIILKNAKKERVTVTVQEPIPGDWKMLKENYPSQKVTSNLAVWKIEIPAESQAILNYRVQLKQ